MSKGMRLIKGRKIEIREPKSGGERRLWKAGSRRLPFSEASNSGCSRMTKPCANLEHRPHVIRGRKTNNARGVLEAASFSFPTIAQDAGVLASAPRAGAAGCSGSSTCGDGNSEAEAKVW